MNLDGIPELAKSVGGLTVTVPNNSLEYKYPEFSEGAEVTLTEENTETFVRSRDVDESQSAIYRMERQKVFLDAFSKKAKECYEQNAKFAADLFVAIKPYTVTNISEDRLMKLFQTGTVCVWQCCDKAVIRATETNECSKEKEECKQTGQPEPKKGSDHESCLCNISCSGSNICTDPVRELCTDAVKNHKSFKGSEFLAEGACRFEGAEQYEV